MFFAQILDRRFLSIRTVFLLFEQITTTPVCVVVMNRKGVGKSTLIRSLVKHHSKQTIMDIIGPITLRTSKTQRVTLL